MADARGMAAVLLVVVLVGTALPVAHAAGATRTATSARSASDTAPAARPVAPGAAGASGRLAVGTNDTGAAPNSGLRANLTAFPSEPLPSDTSIQVSASETIGGFDAVFGIFQNTLMAPVVFFSVFDNTTNANVRLVYWQGLPVLAGSTYDFQLVAQGSTTWELTVNGQEFGGNASSGTFDFGTGTANWVGGILFTEIAFYQGEPPVPALLTIPDAFAVREGSGWYLPRAAASVFSTVGGVPWGIEGRLQHPSLPPGELETGTSVPAVPNGTALWSGPPVPVRVGLSISPGQATATTQVEVDATVTDLTGTPIPGVPLFIGDGFNGTSITSPLFTDSTGNVVDAFLLGNVSGNTSDLIRADVTALGYVGKASRSVAVVPPVHVLLSPVGLPNVVPPGGSFTLTLSARNESGGLAPGDVVLTTSQTAGATITPEFGASDAMGTITIEVIAPLTLGPLVLWVNLTSPGTWGHLVVSIDVGQPPVSAWNRYSTPIAELGGVAVLGVVLVLFWRRRRARQRPLPPSPNLQWPSAKIVPSKEGEAPVSRTPPSAGSP